MDETPLAYPSLLVLAPRRGRPKAKEPGVPLTVWVPTGAYDQIVELANARGQSVSSLARESLVRDLLTITRR